MGLEKLSVSVPDRARVGVQLPAPKERNLKGREGERNNKARQAVRGRVIRWLPYLRYLENWKAGKVLGILTSSGKMVAA